MSEVSNLSANPLFVEMSARCVIRTIGNTPAVDPKTIFHPFTLINSHIPMCEHFKTAFAAVSVNPS